MSKLPEHLPNGVSREAAIAPYNFVELPEVVVHAEDEQQPVTHDRYHEGRHTGRIECTLTTSSPLYVRCALTTDQFAEEERQRQNPHNNYRDAVKNTPDFFYTHDKEHPIIPGSSLRGMLRTMVEIVGFGKMTQVTDQQHYFFRAVAAKRDDPLAQPYKSLLKNVRAGYLVKRNDGWYIQPTRTIGSDTFIKVRERDIPPSIGLARFNHRNYRPQYIDISFTHRTVRDRRTGKERVVVDKIGERGVYENQGVLVTSGNMLETATERALSPRRNHCVVPMRNTNAQPILIDEKAITDYRSGLTDFQKEAPFDRLWGMLKDNWPVFYCEPPKGQPITFFGQSPNFRIPYRFDGSTRAASPYDFIPTELKRNDIVDLAEAIFGYVRGKKQEGESEQARAGRVFVGDATLNAGQSNVWLREEPITPHILATPKPTTFQHYLVQPTDDKANLKHYASTPGEKTVIRGHKLYWHQGEEAVRRLEDREFLKQPEVEQKKDTQHTQFKPISAGVSFTFTIHFENLSDVELGALLWVLTIASQEQYRLKLGMGKPLGMGAVQIMPKLVLSNRQDRYKTLFNGDTWETGEQPQSNSDVKQFIDAFCLYIQQATGEKVLEKSPRIKMLLAMLSWPGPQPVEEKTRYMEIERDRSKHLVGRDSNEYKERFVLPSPLEVVAQPERPKSDIPQVGDIFTVKIIDDTPDGIELEAPSIFYDQDDREITVPSSLKGKILCIIRPDMKGTGKYKIGNSRRVKVVNVRIFKGLTILELEPVKKS